MTLNGVMAVILHYFSEFEYLPGVLRKSSRSLSHLLMSSCVFRAPVSGDFCCLCVLLTHCFAFHFLFTARRHASAVYAVVVCLSVTSRCSSETAKRRIAQTTPHDSPQTPVSRCRSSWQNLNGVTPNEGSKCRWGRLDDFRQITRYSSKTSTGASVVNLVRSHVYHTERPPSFAARVP